jgi:hypothetical protein
MKPKRKPKTKRSPLTHQKNGARKDYKSPAQKRAAKLKTPNNKIPGRPSRYPEVNKKKIFQYYLLGLTDEEVGALLEPPVSAETINSWKKQYPEFLSTIVAAKEGADAMVANALYSRAIGAKVKSTKFFYNPKYGAIHKQDYIEHYPPDPNAAQFWLRNRQGKHFKERQDDTLPGPTTVNVSIVTDPETLRKLKEDHEAKEKSGSE